MTMAVEKLVSIVPIYTKAWGCLLTQEISEEISSEAVPKTCSFRNPISWRRAFIY